MSKENITIVTAFSDIGRGNISKEEGCPEFLIRTVDYFSNLASLENEMIIFTSS